MGSTPFPRDRELCSWASLPCPWQTGNHCCLEAGLRPESSPPPPLPPYSPHQGPPCFSTAPAGLGHPASPCHTGTLQHKVTLLKSHPSRKKPQCMSLQWQRITCLQHACDNWKDTGTGCAQTSAHQGGWKRGKRLSPTNIHTKITQKLRKIFTPPY